VMTTRATIPFVVVFLSASVGIQSAGLAISSPAFTQNGVIPTANTCDGSAGNPRLVFADVPSRARSLAVIVEDPDVPRFLRSNRVFMHWAKWDLAPETTGVAEGKADGGINEDGGPGYLAPCPPSGEHRYIFKLFALDTVLGPRVIVSTPGDLSRAMQGHILAQAETTGRYRRPGASSLDPFGVLICVTALYGMYRGVRVVLRHRRAG
jgi:Raf kinase inhibitor-like YbhB/YbcL family protein